MTLKKTPPTSTPTDVLGSCIAFLLVAAYLVGAALLNAFTAVTLYNWFLIKTYSLPALTYLNAYGIMLLISFVFKTEDPKTEDNKISDHIATLVIRNGFVLLIGYVVHSFM